MQAPLHCFMPVGQAGTQAPLTQETEPPSGGVQVVQAAPHAFTSVLSWQPSSHRWKPALQRMPHSSF